MSDQPALVLCQYRVKPGSEEELTSLCRDHDVALRKLDLVTEEPGVLYRGADAKGRPTFWKTFVWKNEKAVAAAHQHPEVALLWEKMEPLCEVRDGLPSMEFPHVERIVL